MFMSIKISKEQKYVKLFSEGGTGPLFHECENGHFTRVKSKYKTYWDEHCIICGGKIVR